MNLITYPKSRQCQHLVEGASWIMITTATALTHFLDTPECINAITQFNLSNLHRVVWLNTGVIVHPDVTSMQVCARASASRLEVFHQITKAFLGEHLNALLHVRAHFNVIMQVLRRTWRVVIHSGGRHKGGQ